VATYKQPCIHCGFFLDTSNRFCPKCESTSPFGYSCPTCLHDVQKDFAICPGCGRPLYILCPHCKARTFVQNNCEQCGCNLTFPCENKRCGSMQFFENTKCTACGKKLKQNKMIQ